LKLIIKMGFEEDVKNADLEIESDLGKVREELIVKYYKPLFDKVKTEALKYLNESGESYLSLEPAGLVFKDNGHFSNALEPMYNGDTRRFLNNLPYEYTGVMPRDTPLEDKRDYHVRMKYALNDFRKKVLEAITKPLNTTLESITAPLA